MAERNEFVSQDYLQEMRDRVTFAFEDSPVFDKYLQLFNLEYEALQELFRQLMQERSIDTAQGKQLDIIGDIVGQPRELIDSDLLPYFGFEGAGVEQSYGDLYDDRVGGYYWDINTPLAGSVLLNDDQYRIFIKAKILKNVTRATPEDVINFISFVFGVKKIQITVDSGATQAVVIISDDLNLFERRLLKYFFTTNKYKSYFVPKPLGVGFEFGVAPTDDYFSYLGTPDGLGFGELIDDEVVGGGEYASLF